MSEKKKEKKKVIQKTTRHNWQRIEKAWLSGKYTTLLQLGRKYKVPYGLLTKRSMTHRWIARRREIMQKGRDKADEKLVETYAQKYYKMCERHINLSKILQSKGLAYLGQNDIDTSATAVNAIFRGATLEKNVMDGKQSNGTPSVNIFNSQNITTNLRGLTDAELQVIASGGKLIESGAGSGAGDTIEEEGTD